MKKIIFALIFTLSLSQLVLAQVKNWKNPKSSTTIEMAQWEVGDIIYTTKKKVEKPFAQEAYAIVTGNGQTQKIPMFYNGNKEWVFRYSSDEVGAKTFVIESALKELNGKKGNIKIISNTKTNRHGGIVLHEDNPQRFFYEDGSHYFNLAFECDWLFALDYGQDELKKTDHLLSLVEENGFNQVVMNVYTYDVKWKKDPKLKEHPEHEYGGREDIFPFLGSNSDPDYSALNVDFFKHFDKVMTNMHDKEIVSHLMIYVWNKLVNWPEIQSDADNMYYDYVIKRYQAFPNLIWDVSKEALSYGKVGEEYILERIERTRELDSYKRLVSVHDYGFCKRNSEKVDFISLQNWDYTLYNIMYDALQEFPDKPIFNIEHGGYEESPYWVFPGAYINAETCLRRNYKCVFAGGYSTYYWQGTSWNAIIHNPYEQPDDFIKPHFEYFKHMRTLMDSVNFENCRNWPQFNHSGYNLINEKDGIYLIYVPKESHYAATRLAMRKYNTDDATIQWFNVLTGEFTELQSYKKGKPSAWDQHHPRPFRYEVDAVLIVRGLKPLEK
ncbi:apiosidase-like domain-containing protein [Reichenbachiella versicolor]|uniref:apiosidase-like domain-containing protein n=1 Tax=Reichenbachiella versicolor TaxID=1821036 RepID=UPI000D6E02F4|nr:DUF4038 domain-containing protein [Reichenbachiella versicolor]